MEIEAVKILAAAIALLPILGVGIGLGIIFGAYNLAVSRNPSSAELLEKKFLLMFALTEALAIFAVLFALLFIYVV